MLLAVAKEWNDIYIFSNYTFSVPNSSQMDPNIATLGWIHMIAVIT